MTRRGLLAALLAAPALSVLPKRADLAPRLRCDAAWVEAEFRAGRPVRDRHLVVRRPINVTADMHVVVIGCWIVAEGPAFKIPPPRSSSLAA